VLIESLLHIGKGRVSMKRIRTAIVVVAALSTIVLAAVPAVRTASASAAATTAPFTATISGQAGFTLGCCYTYIGLAPTETVLPRIGRATVSGYIEWCGISPYSPCPERNGTTLSLVIATTSGDTLTLGGYNPIADPLLTWHVVGGTGRFAAASGSGDYTYNVDVQDDVFIVTIALAGTLSMH
jgi:hypothetical protein